MKKTMTALLLLLLATGAAANTTDRRDGVEEVRNVIMRTFGSFPENAVLEIVPARKGDAGDRFEYSVRKGELRISGSSRVALCRGFYDYITRNGYGVATWSCNRLDLPDVLPDCDGYSAVSPFEHRLYYNVCTNGYSTPYWGWREWEREIDWMALHGFDMPLAPVAGEAIFARVWRDMGLTDEEINTYFTGPSHMPWMRMGNMTGLDGAPSAAWHEAQIALQHKIVDRMRSLGMKPVFQGFAGFVPEAMKRHYPQVDLTTTSWSGFHNYMISPTDELFAEIERRFIEAWEREFGKGKYYLIDSFNELDIPFGEQGSAERAELLHRYSSTIYRSLQSANPDAVWVMQGWMFGYQRNIWDPQSIEALLSGVPDDKMLIIDLAVDFNRFVWKSRKTWEYVPGLYGKRWIYSTTPNFGGRSALTGVLESYANGHIEALRSPNRGELVGYGTSPEGIEQNEIVYEVLADAAWRTTEIDLEEFLCRYSAARYGECPSEMREYWRGLLASVYGRFTNNARYNWQLRPYSGRIPTMGIGPRYFEAVEKFMACGDSLGGSEAYRTDAVCMAAFYLGAKADALLDMINWAYVENRTEDVPSMERRFFSLLADADRLLESHPILRLQRWVDMAERCGASAEESDAFVEESRRLVTVWGGPNLSDYSARVWSGLIRDYYIPRWRKYFEALRDGKTFDFSSDDERYHSLRGISAVEPFADPLAAARQLVEAAADIPCTNVYRPTNAAAFVVPCHYAKKMVWLNYTVSDEQYRRAVGLRFHCTHGEDAVLLKRVTFKGHNEKLNECEIGRKICKNEDVVITLKGGKTDGELPQEITMQIVIDGCREADNYLSVELLY